MNKNQKSFANIIFVIVIVAILIGAVGYFVFVKKSGPIAQQLTSNPTQTKISSPVSTTKDETANWKTYYNNDYGYSISVPTDIGIEVNPTTENINLGGAANIGISVYLKKNDSKGGDIFEKPELYQYVGMTIGGNKAYRHTGYGTAGAFFVTTLFYGPTYNYEIMFSDEHGTAKIDIANQIVDTFKFTK